MDLILQALALHSGTFSLLLVTPREEEFIRGLFNLEGESFLRLKHKCESEKLSLTQNRKKWIKEHKVELSLIVKVMNQINEAVRIISEVELTRDQRSSDHSQENSRSRELVL